MILFIQEAQRFSTSCHRSEQAAQLPRTEVEDSTGKLSDARTTNEYFHETHERNLAESPRLVAERDRAMFEGRAMLQTYEEERKKMRDVAGEIHPSRKGSTSTI